jgi:hypothetical protein
LGDHCSKEIQNQLIFQDEKILNAKEQNNFEEIGLIEKKYINSFIIFMTWLKMKLKL